MCVQACRAAQHLRVARKAVAVRQLTARARLPASARCAHRLALGTVLGTVRAAASLRMLAVGVAARLRSATQLRAGAAPYERHPIPPTPLAGTLAESSTSVALLLAHHIVRLLVRLLADGSAHLDQQQAWPATACRRLRAVGWRWRTRRAPAVPRAPAGRVRRRAHCASSSAGGGGGRQCEPRTHRAVFVSSAGGGGDGGGADGASTGCDRPVSTIRRFPAGGADRGSDLDRRGVSAAPWDRAACMFARCVNGLGVNPGRTATPQRNNPNL